MHIASYAHFMCFQFLFSVVFWAPSGALCFVLTLGPLLSSICAGPSPPARRLLGQCASETCHLPYVRHRSLCFRSRCAMRRAHCCFSLCWPHCLTSQLRTRSCAFGRGGAWFMSSTRTVFWPKVRRLYLLTLRMPPNKMDALGVESWLKAGISTWPNSDRCRCFNG